MEGDSRQSSSRVVALDDDKADDDKAADDDDETPGTLLPTPTTPTERPIKPSTPVASHRLVGIVVAVVDWRNAANPLGSRSPSLVPAVFLE